MSTVEQVQQRVMTSMLRGEMAPGTWVRQDELANQLGVSKIPVREALHRLAANGLLRFEPNRGAVVPLLSASDAEEIFALRLATEPMLLARSVPALSVVDLAEAELALGSDDKTGTDANWRFHRALYQAGGWDRGLALCETLHASVAPYVTLYTDDLGGAPESDAEHLALLAHCRSGDVHAAVGVVEQHLQSAAAALVAYLSATEQ